MASIKKTRRGWAHPDRQRAGAGLGIVYMTSETSLTTSARVPRPPVATLRTSRCIQSALASGAFPVHTCAHCAHQVAFFFSTARGLDAHEFACRARTTRPRPPQLRGQAWHARAHTPRVFCHDTCRKQPLRRRPISRERACEWRCQGKACMVLNIGSQLGARLPQRLGVLDSVWTNVLSSSTGTLIFRSYTYLTRTHPCIRPSAFPRRR